jgi:hypothetical protein
MATCWWIVWSVCLCVTQHIGRDGKEEMGFFFDFDQTRTISSQRGEALTCSVKTLLLLFVIEV